MAAVLSDEERGLFRAIPLASNASRADLFGAVRDQFTQISPEGSLLIYYSGHAFLGKHDRLFLALQSTVRDDPYVTGVYLADLVALLDESSVGSLVFIFDCCFSGAIQTSFKELQAEKDVWIVTSSTSDQSSFEKEGSKNSILTGFLLDGLGGLADSDNTGEITVFEAFDYARRCVDAVFSSTGRSQSPMIFVPVGSRGVMVLGRNPSAAPIDLDAMQLDAAPVYVAAKGLAELTKSGAYGGLIRMTRGTSEYFIEGRPYRNLLLQAGRDYTPNMVVRADGLECDAFFPPSMLAPEATAERQIANGVVRVRLWLPFSNISGVQIFREEDARADEFPAVELLPSLHKA